ncbi:amidohydrolase family protein [bacterium]|nr:amidohydrolase family protein [bacterium]
MKARTLVVACGVYLVLVCFWATFLFAATKAELILYNGKIITVDSQDHIYQAVAVKNGKILQLGTDAEIKLLVGPRCKMIDLKGKTVTPGLIDSHYHLMYYGAQFWPGYLNIRHPVVTSKADLLRVLGDYARQLQPGEWISGNQGFTLKAYETVDRWDLDPVIPNNPAYLRHSSGQFSVVNSLALSVAGITKDTPNPPGSLIMCNAEGEPTGILSHYPAENLVAVHATGYGDRKDEQKFEDIEVAQQLCFAAGYTSVQDVIVGSVKDIMLYKQFAESGRLKVRLYAMLYIDYPQEADTLAKVYAPIDTGRFKFGGWKLAMDGGIAARTTLLYNKNLYASQISYPYHSQDELNRMVKTLYNTGLQVAVHVLGDEGIDMTITAFEEAMRANPRPDPRLRIEHGLFPSTAALDRLKNSNIIISTQPQWITWYGDGYREATDDATMNQLLPFKTMLDKGIHLAFGCDVPASLYQEPKFAFKGAVLRRTASNIPITQGERLTSREALWVHTMGSAYASFSEDSTGSLEIGKYADMVVWSHDLYTMTGAETNDLAAEMTIVNGEIVFDAGKLPITSYSDLWLVTADMNHIRQDHTATLLQDGKVLITGWESNKAELFDLISGTFAETGSTNRYHRQGETATLLNDGRVLLAGGDFAQKVAEIYDPNTNTFNLTDSLSSVHSYHSATLLSNGKVLIAGGQDQNGPQTHAIAEIYDPQTGKFTLTGSLNEHRSGHTATLLPNGKVLITGGIQTTTPGSGIYLKSCEIYDPSTGTFSLARSLNQARVGHAATRLVNDNVLISGGAYYSNKGELYDYLTDSWSYSGSMNVSRRSYHTASLLPDGRVLIAGGRIDAVTATAEIFDPATATFTLTDSMTTPRQNHRATPLSTGDVLVTGGYNGTNTVNSTEIYVMETTTGVRLKNPLISHRSTFGTFLLSQNYPNPFNPVTHFNFYVPSQARIRIAIYNMKGQLTRTILDEERLPGSYVATWDGTSNNGGMATTGMYLARMEAGDQITIRKILYLK